MTIKLFLLCVLLLSFSKETAPGNWELKKDEDGIKVFTRTASTGNLKELRVTCELNCTRAQLINILLDIGNYNDWVYSNKKSVILKQVNPQSVIYYTQSHLPWPIKDRDLVVQLNISPAPGVLNIQAVSIPGYLPQSKNFIRVPYSLATWKVTQGANKNKLQVDYTFSVDPGGSIPSWLINATLTIGPYNSFVKLRQVLNGKSGK